VISLAVYPILLLFIQTADAAETMSAFSHVVRLVLQGVLYPFFDEKASFFSQISTI
jgi:hypothetical protein